MKAKRDQDGYIESGGRLIVLAEMMRDAYENEVQDKRGNAIFDVCFLSQNNIDCLCDYFGDRYCYTWNCDGIHTARFRQL